MGEFVEVLIMEDFLSPDEEAMALKMQEVAARAEAKAAARLKIKNTMNG